MQHARIGLGLQQQCLAEEVECRVIDVGVQTLGAGNSTAQEGYVALAVFAAIVDVGAIDREAGNGLANNGFENIVSEVARAPIGSGNTAEQIGQHIDFTCQCGLHALKLGTVNQLIGIDGVAQNLLVDGVEALLVFLADENTVRQVDE